jgi:hypothetical protein
MSIFLLTIILMTQSGPISYTKEFPTNWQCKTALKQLQQAYPQSRDGKCTIL